MTYSDKALFGKRLQKLRAERWLTQEKTAEKLNISLRYYQMLERGENVGSVDLLLQISELFHCSLDYLIKGTYEQESQNLLISKLNSLTPFQREKIEKMLELWIESISEK